MSDAEHQQWPRTVPRWEGDTERDRDWHRFIDADIHDSADKHWRARIEAYEALLKEAMAAPAERDGGTHDSATLAKLLEHLGETE